MAKTSQSDGSSTPHARLVDVSQLAGVSTATISRVLSGKGAVSERLRRRVMAAVHELNYTPNGIARSMASRRTMTLGLVVPDVTNPFFTSVARGVEDRGRRDGYAVLLCNTDEDEETEIEYLNLLRQRRVDGILLVSAGGDSSHIRSLAGSGTKVVLLDRGVPGLDMPDVQVDSVTAVHEATSYLLGLGHRDIAIVSGRRSVSNSRERLEGYVWALRERGMPVRDSLILDGHYTHDGGHACGMQIAAADPRPTAVLCCNNVMTTGLLLALRESHLAVPEDISVISFDDLPYFELLDHPLTAIQQPMYELGDRACELLIDIVTAPAELPEVHTHVRLPARLMLRDSCRRIDA